MINLLDLYKIAKSNLACITCNTKFQRENIALRGAFDNKLIMETYCENGHLPTVAIYITSYKNINPSVDLQEDYKLVTNQDVMDVKIGLKNFNGDFEKLFSQTTIK